MPLCKERKAIIKGKFRDEIAKALNEAGENSVYDGELSPGRFCPEPVPNILNDDLQGNLKGRER